MSFLGKFVYSAFYSAIVFFLPIGSSKDAHNYLQYLTSSEELLSDAAVFGYLNLFASEPIWLIINIFITSIFEFDNEILLLFYSIFIAFSISMFVIKFSNSLTDYFLTTTILLSPFLISNYVTHIRMGFALAIILTAIQLDNKKMAIALMCITPLIHNAFFLVSFFLLISYLLILSDSKIINIFAVVVINLIIVLAVLPIAQILKHSTIDNVAETTVSGLGLVFFFVQISILIIGFVHDKRPLRNNNYYLIVYFTSLSVIFYIFNYYFFYGAGRIMQIALPFLAAGLVLSNIYVKLLSLPLWIAYVAYDISIRTSIEGYGF